MLDSLITSKTRVKLLLKFFLNPEARAHLRGLEEELGESTNGIRIELNRLEEARMIESEFEGQKKIFKVCTTHPLYEEIHSIVRKNLGLDHIVDKLVAKLGGLEKAFLIGSFANGIASEYIELALIGEIDEDYLHQLIAKAEGLIKRKIKYILLDNLASDDVRIVSKPYLLLWSRA